MSEILVIGESEVAEGFAMAGARVETDSDPERLSWLVPELIRNRSYTVVLVTERVFEQLDERVRTRAEASGRPLFVTIPSPAGTGPRPGEDAVSRIIRRAIGYRLKVKR